PPQGRSSIFLRVGAAPPVGLLLFGSVAACVPSDLGIYLLYTCLIIPNGGLRYL
ncbi:hypothetical protein KSS87_007397, partial [Heliosperma pusillum]